MHAVTEAALHDELEKIARLPSALRKGPEALKAMKDKLFASGHGSRAFHVGGKVDAAQRGRLASRDFAQPGKGRIAELTKQWGQSAKNVVTAGTPKTFPKGVRRPLPG